MNLTITRYGRFWAVYQSGALLAVCVYLKGARAVVAAVSTAAVTAEYERSAA
jgi:hypothetical protein